MISPMWPLKRAVSVAVVADLDRTSQDRVRTGGYRHEIHRINVVLADIDIARIVHPTHDVPLAGHGELLCSIRRSVVVERNDLALEISGRAVVVVGHPCASVRVHEKVALSRSKKRRLFVDDEDRADAIRAEYR
jgi:hypothetical protein